MTTAIQDISLMAHLMRRAGFGATRKELEFLQSKDYETVVDDLINPERFPQTDENLYHRYLPYDSQAPNHRVSGSLWLYRMINTQRPLEEKMTLFWHHVFATGGSKIIIGRVMTQQIETFRRLALGNLRTLLVEVSKNPAMIFWLDNWENRRDSINENYGRELLELFSMGVGNYTEEDVKAAARAFTGWTFSRTHPVNPYFVNSARFEFDTENHDYSEKEFLGQKGPLNGEDVIDIILSHEATANFIARHLYNFFIADEVPVPSWNTTPPRDPEAIRMLAEVMRENDYDMRAVMRTLFLSDFFKDSTFDRVRSPVELAVGVVKMTGGYPEPDEELREDIYLAADLMGQQLLNPPGVEGWQTGESWINSGALVERVNFVSRRFNDVSNVGVKEIISHVLDGEANLTPDKVVDRCLDILGPFSVEPSTKTSLINYADDCLSQCNSDNGHREQAIAQVLGAVAATREYQFG